eukprot:753088-Hanusia_phi.AAC.2
MSQPIKAHRGTPLTSVSVLTRRLCFEQEYRLCYNFSPSGILGPMIEILTRKDAKIAGWVFVGQGCSPEFAEKISDTMFKNLRRTMYDYYSVKFPNLKHCMVETELQYCESLKGLVILRSQKNKMCTESEMAHYFDDEIYEYASPFRVKEFVKGLVRFQKGDVSDVPNTIPAGKTSTKSTNIVVDLISDDEDQGTETRDTKMEETKTDNCIGDGEFST